MPPSFCPFQFLCFAGSISFLLTARGGAYSTGFPSHVRAGRVLIPTKSHVTWVTLSMCASTKGRPTQAATSCIFSRKLVVICDSRKTLVVSLLIVVGAVDIHPPRNCVTRSCFLFASKRLSYLVCFSCLKCSVGRSGPAHSAQVEITQLNGVVAGFLW